MTRHLPIVCRSFIVLGTAATLVITVIASASAQGLGDLARREQARREGGTSSGKAYTNGDLPNVEPAAAVTAPAAAPGDAAPSPQADAKKGAGDASTPAAGADAKADPKKEEKKDEEYWRKRVKAERDALARAESFAEALQSRINALSTDFVNRDDPAQRNVVAADRQKALSELERVQKEIVDHQKAISDIQQEARRAGVPAGWVR